MIVDDWVGVVAGGVAYSINAAPRKNFVDGRVVL
jgi:hypothetical protein